MRKRIAVHTCNRCSKREEIDLAIAGAVQPEGWAQFGIWDRLSIDGSSTYSYDFCDGCYEAFKNWMDELPLTKKQNEEDAER